MDPASDSAAMLSVEEAMSESRNEMASSRDVVTGEDDDETDKLVVLEVAVADGKDESDRLTPGAI